MSTKTTVVNLWGGPGCGKSTLAAGVYAELKNRGVSCELVREYVKAWAWRGDKIRRWDELYLLAKQLREESNLYGCVEYLITDRPLALSAVYAARYTQDGEWIAATVRGILNAQVVEGIRQHNVIVVRKKAYVQAGRFESESDAREVDAACREYLGAVGEVSSVTDVLLGLGL